MPAIETYFVTVAATITASAAVYTAKVAHNIGETVNNNKQRSETNRRAVRAIIEDDTIEVDADPLTGLQEDD